MLLLKDNCSLCDRVFPHFALRRCYRCKRLYCRDCTMYTKDGEIICLNCARRTVSPKKLGTKYSPFSRYLLRRGKYTSQVRLSFAKIEGIITDNLPFGAIRSQEWWKNTSSTSQGRAWLNVGWKVQDVDLSKRMVTLARDAGAERDAVVWGQIAKELKEKEKQDKMAKFNGYVAKGGGYVRR